MARPSHLKETAKAREERMKIEADIKLRSKTWSAKGEICDNRKSRRLAKLDLKSSLKNSKE